MPNLFWQILRPYIPQDTDFDRSFAETFAIPEFRTITGGSATAASRLVGLLSTYHGLPEQTIVKIVSNDLLIDGLRHIQDDRQFQEYVDNAIAQNNASLVEENAALERRIQEDARRLKESEHIAREELRRREDEKERLQAELKEKDRLLVESDRRRNEKMERLETALEDARRQDTDRAVREKNAIKAAEHNADLAAVFGGVLAAVLFEAAVWVLPWSWLLEHPNSYGIQISICLLIILAVAGLFRTSWRNWGWGAAGLTLLATLAQILGGPHVK